MKVTREMIENSKWNLNVSNREKKEELGRKIAKRVKDGEVIGFGSGTTSFIAVKEIGKRVKEEGLHIKAIPTSSDIEMLCEYFNIPVTSLNDNKPDWCFDGADEVDSNGWLIKGKGAAMFREKLNIVNSNENYILVDSSKMVNELGDICLVPIEVFPMNLRYVQEKLVDFGAEHIEVRKDKDENDFITENGNKILDVKFKKIYGTLEKDVKEIVGVIESGLFLDYNVIIEKVG